MPKTHSRDSKEVLHIAVICLASLLSYLNSTRCGFAFDDIHALKNNADLRPTTPISALLANDFWGFSIVYPFSHGSYRPLSVLTFRWNYSWSQLQPFAYHLTNVFLHVIVTWLTYCCSIALSFKPTTALTTSLLFAVHPVHTEAVTGVVGRADLLSALFFFSGLIFYLKAINGRGFLKVVSLSAALSSILLASLSKETGITLAGLMIFYEIAAVLVQMTKNNRNGDVLQQVRSLVLNLLNIGPVLRMAAVLVTAVGFLVARMKLMGRVPIFTPQENPVPYAAFPVRQLTYAYLLPLNAQLLLYPWSLCVDWSMGSIRLIEGWTDWRNIVTVLFFIGIILVAVKIVKTTLRRRFFDIKLAISLALIAIPFIPASNLFIRVGFVIAERILYIPSFGCCALVAIGFERLSFIKRPSSCIMNFLLVLTVSSFFARTFVRNFDWIDEGSLSLSGIKFNPMNAKLYQIIGVELMKKQHVHEAFAYSYKAATTYSPFYFFNTPHEILTIIFMMFELPQFTERQLRRQLVFLTQPAPDPRSLLLESKLDALVDLADILANSTSYSRLVEANNMYEAIFKERPHFFYGNLRRGEVLLKMGQLEEAGTMFNELLKLKPKCGRCFYNLALVNFAKNESNVTDTMKLLEKAIRFEPDHYYALHAFALTTLKWRLPEESRRLAINFTKKVVEAERRYNQTLTRDVRRMLPIPEEIYRRMDAPFVAAIFEFQDGDLKAGMDFLEEALRRIHASSRDIYLELASSFHELCNKEVSLESNSSLEKLETRLFLGYLHLVKMNIVEARQDFLKIAEKSHAEESDATIIRLAKLELCLLSEKQASVDECLAKELLKSK